MSRSSLLPSIRSLFDSFKESLEILTLKKAAHPLLRKGSFHLLRKRVRHYNFA